MFFVRCESLYKLKLENPIVGVIMLLKVHLTFSCGKC